MNRLSEKWLKRFELFRQVGADTTPLLTVFGSKEFKSLKAKERSLLTFNLWAFFFGPFYYLAKKMWAKAAMLIALCWMVMAVVAIFERLLGFTAPVVVYSAVVAVVFATMASYDYFRLVTAGEKVWPELPPALKKRWVPAASPLIAFVALVVVSMDYTGLFGTPACGSDTIVGTVKDIAHGEMVRQAGYENAAGVSYSLDAIRTTHENPQTGAYTCAANLTMTHELREQSIPVTYTVESTSDGNFYVNVSGL